MRMGSNNMGYTIVEVMIFLAISGLMFVVAADFINGKQSVAEFRQSMNDINNVVQQTINQVGDGNYNNDNDVSCSASGGSLTIASGSGEQGSNGGIQTSGNGGCVFLGKVIQFGIAGTNGAYKYNIYTVAGSQYSSTQTTGPAFPPNFANADPTAIDNSSINLTDYNTFEWDSSVTRVFNVSTGTDYDGIGFFGNYGNYTPAGSNPNTATVSTLAVAFAGSTSDAEKPTMLNNISSGASYDTFLAANPYINIDVCIKSGSTEYGILNIGGTDGERLSSNYQIYTDYASWHAVGC